MFIRLSAVLFQDPLKYALNFTVFPGPINYDGQPRTGGKTNKKPVASTEKSIALNLKEITCNKVEC